MHYVFFKFRSKLIICDAFMIICFWIIWKLHCISTVRIVKTASINGKTRAEISKWKNVHATWISAAAVKLADQWSSCCFFWMSHICLIRYVTVKIGFFACIQYNKVFTKAGLKFRIEKRDRSVGGIEYEDRANCSWDLFWNKLLFVVCKIQRKIF